MQKVVQRARSGALVLFLCLSAVSTSACLLGRVSHSELVLKDSPAAEREVVSMSPILLARQEKAEKTFFGFQKNSKEERLNYQEFPLDGETLPLSSEDVVKEKVFDAARLLWPVGNGRITSPFGMRRGRLHAGIDIGAVRGTPIVASLSGQVLISARRRAYGKVVVLGHDHDHQTLYAHMLRMKVKPGQFVNRGDVIGYVGRTGRATGYHLHFETRVAGGVPQDPMRFLPSLEVARSKKQASLR